MKSTLKLNKYELKDLRRKYDRFINNLSPAQLVVFSATNMERMFGELAYYTIVQHDNENFMKTFNRSEVEIIQNYYIRLASHELLKSKFPAYDSRDVILKFTHYCEDIYDPNIKSFDTGVKLFIIKLCENSHVLIVTRMNYAKRHLSSIFKRLTAFVSTKLKLFRLFLRKNTDTKYQK